MADGRIQKPKPQEREREEAAKAEPVDLSQKSAELREAAEEISSAIDDVLEEVAEEQIVDQHQCGCGRPIDNCQRDDARGIGAWSS